jgi:phosphatidylinositol 3-kinase
VLTAFEARLSNTPFCMDSIEETYVEDSSTPFKSIVDSVAKLGSTLRKTEKHEQISSESKAKLSKERSMWDVLTEQDAFFSGVLNIQQRCRDSRGKKDAKEAELKSMLLREGYDRNDSREAVPLPSRPEFFVNGVNPETATMFKSALYPALLDFHVEGVMKSSSHGQTIISSGKTEKATKHSDEARCRNYKVIVKTGDDLRQDQLVVMMLQLMDGLLKRAALDLCLTPYSILAMSTSSGFVEFVEGAIPISQILSKYNGSILHFFQTVAFQKGAKYDIRPDVISNYVRSCAGYCVITYILGVGDRHLDNILLRASGHFFHIDFGFIFGRDPKPLPPAFRLTREVSLFD